MEKLSDIEIERYARQIILPEIGGNGQQKLKAAKVCVIGAGGLGSPVLLYLAASGVGTLGVVDDDIVSLTNLQRQVIHSSSAVHQPKTKSAATTLNEINPHSTIKCHQERITNENAARLLAEYDIVVDGSDNFETRYLIADTAAMLKIPLVSGALGRFDGSLTVLMPYVDRNPGYRDLFPEAPPAGAVPNCAEAGVLGALAGVIGSLQATEVIKLITGAGKPLIGRLLLYDSLEARFDQMTYQRRS